jgi:putative ABC transport system permease protein
MFHEILISIKLAISNLKGNIGRTVLTLVGIVIAITAVIMITASGQGLQNYLLAEINSFGSDYIQVEPKVPSPERMSGHINTMTVQITTLKMEDAEAAAKLPNVKSFYGSSIGQNIVSYQDTNKRTMLIGASAQAPSVDEGIKLEEGNFYTDSDDRGLAQVAVIGSEVKTTFFGNDDPIGKDLKIKGENFKVIGVLAKRGSMGFFSFDQVVYIPIRTLQKKINGTDYIAFYTLKVNDLNQIDSTMADVTDLMSRRHRTTDPDKYDFIVSSAQEARDIIASVFNAVNILLLALVSISLIVGGVGIMNVMYVAVVERTFEIGLRKALGATSQVIMRQFLLEAIFITLSGGILGIIFGYLFSFLATFTFAKLGYDLQLAVTLDSIILAVGFSVATGIIFGIYPAYRASKLSPMEALRKN